MPSTSRVPCRNSPALSTAIAPAAVVVFRPASITTATSAAASPPTATTSWAAHLAGRGRNASISTPRQAAPNTISTGASPLYEMDGAVTVSAASTVVTGSLLPVR